MAVLITAPPICFNTRLGEYPPIAVSEISKPVGGVTVISPLKPVPATVNLPTLGLSPGEPTQPIILPVMVLVVTTGVGPELTVILKVSGLLLQPGPAEMKLPMEMGVSPTFILLVMELEVVLITNTFLESEFTTYNDVPSGLNERPKGFSPIPNGMGILYEYVLVLALITDISLEPCPATYTLLPSVLTTIPNGLFAYVGIASMIVL